MKTLGFLRGFPKDLRDYRITWRRKHSQQQPQTKPKQWSLQRREAQQETAQLEEDSSSRIHR